MSERGSFCTEYIFCNECLARLERRLIHADDPIIHGTKIFGRVIAGFVTGMYPGEEIIIITMMVFRSYDAPCHPVRLSVFADDGSSASLLILPSGTVETIFFSAAQSPAAPAARESASTPHRDQAPL